MYKHVDDWKTLLERLGHPLDYIFNLVNDDNLLLFMPYVVRHERTEVICKLIEPKDVGIEHEWCNKFINSNLDRVNKAKTEGRKRVKNAKIEIARIFMAIAQFEEKTEPFDIQIFADTYGNIKSKSPDPNGFEWEGLDDTYPIALLAKTDAGGAGQLCSLVITLVYKQLMPDEKPKNRKYLEKYLASLAKHKIKVIEAPQRLGDLDAIEWNAFRACFDNEPDFIKFKFHHLSHGGDAKTWEWIAGTAYLKDHVKSLLNATDYALESLCQCVEQGKTNCIDEVLGHPMTKPSIRELLQWDYKGQSLTRSLLMATPISITALGQVNHDYCWCNPFSINELVKKLNESQPHKDECASNIPSSGKLQGAYVYEEDTQGRKGLWLFIHIPGLLTPVTWSEIKGNHPFGNIIAQARKSGAKNVYRIDWKSAPELKKNIWKVNEENTHWATEITSVDEEFGSITHILPQSGLAVFIPARVTKDGRYCWEVDTSDA